MPFKIRNSNSYSLAAQVLALGGEPLIQPIAGDSEAALAGAIRAACEPGCDLLLLSGGVSMGKYDLVEGVLASLGARFFFTGVRIQPGKPLVFGELSGLGGRPLFGLPGNPISTMVTFALFVAPVLTALGGEPGYAPRFSEARYAPGTAEPESRKPGLRRFLPARLTANADAATVAVVPWQGSGDIAGTAQANCLLVVPEQVLGSGETLAPGDPVRVLLI
jgi:molybdopterin molybdotransferase